mmetsp:Transcript_2656/g.5800  ORF Transcript_2656/g.5800 Transcript_2656/m.5800 type:complete len:81 (-) Transcript_2656:603-845(-)
MVEISFNLNNLPFASYVSYLYKYCTIPKLFYFDETPKRSLYSSSFRSLTSTPYGTRNPNMTAAAKKDFVSGLAMLAPIMF